MRARLGEMGTRVIFAMSAPPRVSTPFLIVTCTHTLKLTSSRACPDTTLQSHLRGHWHRDMVQRSEVAKRSVYVRGFSSGAPAEGALRQLMTQFGEVLSVVVKTGNTDTFALIEFSSTEAALCALTHSSPLTLHTDSLTMKPRLLTARKSTHYYKRWARQSQKQRVDVAMATPPSDGLGSRAKSAVMIGGIRLPLEALAAISSASSVSLSMSVYVVCVLAVCGGMYR